MADRADESEVHHDHEWIAVRRTTVGRALYATIVVLSLLHCTSLFIYYWIDDPEVFDFVRLIDMDYEANIPSLFSAFLFLASSFLLLALWRHAKARRQRDAVHWLGLALIFMFLCADEGAKLHEQIGDMMESVVEAEGFLYFPWFIPYLTAFALLSAAYLPFYLRLPRITRKEFLVAAIVFIVGAAGFDILSGKEADLHGTTSMTYSVLYTIEEILEMVGLVLFIQALLRRVKDEGVVLRIT